MRKLILASTLLLFLFSAFAESGDTQQEKKKKGRMISLYGEVYDSFTRGTIKAFITMMNADSTIVDTTTAYVSKYYSYSSWQIEVPRVEGKFIIKATADGYEDTYIDYELTQIGRNRYKEVPQILMKRKQDDDSSIYKDVELDGVVVKGTRIQVAYRGDTIIYDASAFKLPEGSMLDGLISQLPGAELKENGDIYINGKKVDYLTLNGKDFFKGDNKVMLENLPYFTVKDIKVFNKATKNSELAGREIEEPEYVMDVTLKREYSRGYVANAEAGAGTEDRWMAKTFGMFYNDLMRVSLYGNANNVNEDRTPGREGDWDPKKASRGLLTAKQTGIDLNVQDKDRKVDENFNIKLNYYDSDNESRTFSETFADNGSIFSNSWSQNRGKSFTLYANNSLYLSKASLSNSMHLQYSNHRSWSASDDSTYTSTLTNRNEGLGFYHSRYLYFSSYTYKTFSLKSGDLIHIMFDFGYNKSVPTDDFSNDRTFYASTGITERRNRYRDNHSSGYTYNSNVNYRIALPSDWMVSMQYRYGQRYQSEYNERFNLERLPDAKYEEPGWLPSMHEEMMTAFDEANSYSSNSITRTHRMEAGLQKFTKKMFFMMYLPYNFKSERMYYHANAIDTLARRTWREFTPYIHFRTRGNTNTPIEANYRSYVTSPNFGTLMPLTNNSNPLSVTINNPDLKNSMNHNLSGRITFKNDSTARSVYINVDATMVRNAIGNRVVYNAATGAYTRMRDNINGNWRGSLASGWQRALDKKKRFRMDLSGKMEYNRSVDFATMTVHTDGDAGNILAESPLSKVNNVNLIGTTKFTFKQGDFTAGIIGKITSRHTRGNLDIVHPIDANDIQYGMNATYTIPVLKLTIATDLNMYSRRGYESDMMNTDELVWNAQLTRSFCKGALTAKLQAFDILQNLSQIRYSVNAQGRTETWYNYIPRYVMLGLSYKFTRKPKKD